MMVGERSVSHEYNYDILDRLRRYADRTNSSGDPVQEIGDEPYIPADNAEPYGRVKTLPNGTTAIGYDHEGHVDRFTAGGDDYVVSWGAQNRVAKLEVDGDETLFYYDAFGRMIAKGVGSNVEFYFFDGDKETIRYRASWLGNAFTSVAFYSDGELVAVNRLSATGPNDDVLWMLPDQYGTVRDVVRLEKGNPKVAYEINYDGNGKPTSDGGTPQMAFGYRGAKYIEELQGYVVGGRLTSSLLQGRTLAPQSSVGPEFYGQRDPARQEEGPGFWSNPYKWAVHGTANRLVATMGVDFWSNLSDGEYYAIQAGAVGISLIAGATAPLFGTSLSGLAAGGAVSGAIEAGGTYALLQGVDAYSGRNLSQGSWTQFLTESATGALFGGALGGVFGVGGRALASALRPVGRSLAATDVFRRVAQSAVMRKVGHYATMDIGPAAWAGRAKNAASSSDLASNSLQSAGNNFTRREIIEAFSNAQHTATSRAVLEGIIDRSIQVRFVKNLNKAGKIIDGVIQVNRTMSMDDILTTLVHEGRHKLDMVAGVIPTRNPGGVLSLVAELRAWKDSGRFAKANQFVRTSDYRFADMGWREMAIELENSYMRQIGRRLTDDEFRSAIIQMGGF
ncbi:MAG: hypothetical protein QM775_31865 [Pirellulales bacterium]